MERNKVVLKRNSSKVISVDKGFWRNLTYPEVQKAECRGELTHLMNQFLEQ